MAVTAILQRPVTNVAGNVKLVSSTVSITHNNARLYHANGRTYEAVGTDASGNRIYRDTSVSKT